MNKTQIEWVKNPDGSQGYSWNPITGCLNGCEYCYARKLANTRLKERYLANKNVADGAKGGFSKLTVAGKVTTLSEGDYADPFYPRLWEDRLFEPFAGKRAMGKGKGIFVCDMSDLFGIGIPEDWTRKVLHIIKMCPQHRFYLLTKQPQNLIKFSPFPDNCYVGITCDTKKRMVEGYQYLCNIEAKVKYISFEPLLERMDVKSLSSINWAIIGQQTPFNKATTPKIEWVEEIVEACNHASIPVFIKNNLKPFLDTQPTRIVYQYGSGKLRQEFPNEIHT